MLFLQAACPGLAADCGCESTESTSSRSCCCCAATEAASSDASADENGCPHCQQDSNATETDEQANSFCNCGNQPAIPTVPQGVPESSSSYSLNWIISDNASFEAAPVLTIATAHAQVPSTGVLIPNFKQVVYCVWLT